MAGPEPVQTFKALLYGGGTQPGDGMLSDSEKTRVESAIDAAIQKQDAAAVADALDFLARSPQAVVAESVRSMMGTKLAGASFDPQIATRLKGSLARINQIAEAQNRLKEAILLEADDGGIFFDEWSQKIFDRWVYPFWRATEDDGSAIKLFLGATTLFLSTAVKSGIGIEDRVLDHVGDLYKKIGVTQALLARCKRLTASDHPGPQSGPRRTPAKPRSPTRPAEDPKTEPTPPATTPFSRPKSKGD